MATLPKNIAFEQARNELTSCVNYCFNEPLKLEPYELEIILRDLYNETHALAQQHYKEQITIYEKQQKQETESVKTQEKEIEIKEQD